MLRTLLFAPRTFFEARRDELNGVTGGGLVLTFAVATTTVIAVVIRLLTGQITGTTTIPNPDRPPASECGGGGATPTGCAEPAEITTEVGPLAWSRSAEVLPVVFVALVGLALLLAVALYLGAKLGHGTGSFGATVEIAAWGLLPTFLSILVGGVALLVFASQLDLTVSSLDALSGQFQQLQSGAPGLVFLAILFGGAVWQAYIWASGLRVVHRLHRYGAIILAVAVATIPILLL